MAGCWPGVGICCAYRRHQCMATSFVTQFMMYVQVLQGMTGLAGLKPCSLLKLACSQPGTADATANSKAASTPSSCGVSAITHVDHLETKPLGRWTRTPKSDTCIKWHQPILRSCGLQKEENMRGQPHPTGRCLAPAPVATQPRERGV